MVLRLKSLFGILSIILVFLHFLLSCVYVFLIFSWNNGHAYNVGQIVNSDRSVVNKTYAHSYNTRLAYYLLQWLQTERVFSP